jgi:hypothetical protein
VRAVPRLCKVHSGICLTTGEEARKNLIQGKKNLSQVKKNLSQSTVYILPKHQNQYLIGDFEGAKSICLLCGTRITVPPSGIEPQFSTLFDYFTEQWTFLLQVLRNEKKINLDLSELAVEAGVSFVKPGVFCDIYCVCSWCSLTVVLINESFDDV